MFDRGTGLDDLKFPVWMQQAFGIQDRVHRWIAYIMLPIGLALLALRALEGLVAIVRGKREMLIASHEAEDLVAEARNAAAD
jgi:C4-dicarboxylate transporter DctQ subunit